MAVVAVLVAGAAAAAAAATVAMLMVAAAVANRAALAAAAPAAARRCLVDRAGQKLIKHDVFHACCARPHAEILGFSHSFGVAHMCHKLM